MPNSKKNNKKITFFDVAFAVVLFLFFFISLFTCGSFKSTNSSATIKSQENYLAVFEVKGTTKAYVKSVHLSIGHISAMDGEELLVTIKTSTNKTTQPRNSFGEDASQKADGVKIVAGKEGNYLPYNFFKVVSDKENGQETTCISIKANIPFVLHELVCVDKDGEVVPLTVSKTLSKEYVHPVDTLKGAVDAPESFSLKNSARYRFTEQESRMMTAIDNMLLGKSYLDGFVYHANTGAGALATAVYLPSVALLGHSVGALRLTAVLLTTLALAFSYFFVKLLTKSDKNGFIASLFFVLSALPFTAGRLGTPNALIFCTLIGSAYYMLRFFAQGVDGEKVKTSALPILWSGLLSAVAIAVDLTAIFPVLGICVLLAFGLRRQKLAHAVALSEITQEDEQRKEQVNYRYKNTIVWGYAVLSFIVGSFVVILLGGVVGYNSFVRAYDNPSSPVLGFMALLFKSTSAQNIGLSNPFALLLPLAHLQLIDSTAYFTAFFNPVVLVAAVCSAVYAVVLAVLSLIKKQNGKEQKRLRRITLILLSALVSSLLQATLVKELSLLCALPCALSLIAFIPLAYGQIEKRHKLIADIILCVTVSLSAAFFLLTLSQIFGLENALLTLFR